MADIYFKRPGGILKYDSKVNGSLAVLDKKYKRCDKNGKPIVAKAAPKKTTKKKTAKK